MARKKTKLDDVVQIDGKVETKQFTTLEQILGDTGDYVYGTMSEEEYQERIDDMLPVDLQTEASKVGLRPDVNTRILRDRLMDQFRKHVASYRPIKTSSSSVSSISKEAQKVLREGA